MPTQIAATPLITGEDALRGLEEARRMPTEETRKALKRWEKEFSKMVVEEDDDE